MAYEGHIAGLGRPAARQAPPGPGDRVAAVALGARDPHPAGGGRRSRVRAGRPRVRERRRHGQPARHHGRGSGHRAGRRARASSPPRCSTPTARSACGPPRCSRCRSCASPHPRSRRCSEAATSRPGWASPAASPPPTFPPGLQLDRFEGAGEVQTPVLGARRRATCASATASTSGTPRRASCASASTRSTSCPGDRVVDEVPTYRGEGKTFL